MSLKLSKQTEEKNINIKINSNLYNKIKILAAILESRGNKKIQINELMNEAMELLLEEYNGIIKEQLNDFFEE